LLTKGYGAAFLNTLPSPTVRKGPLAGLARATEDWLNAAGAPAG
jgi:hypothetical protein